MTGQPARFDAGARRVCAPASLHAAVLLFGLAGLFGRWIDYRVVEVLAWGALSGFAFALLAVSNRVLAARRAPAAIAFWQNVGARYLAGAARRARRRASVLCEQGA